MALFTNVYRVDSAEKRMHGLLVKVKVDGRLYRRYISDIVRNSVGYDLAMAELAGATMYQKRELLVRLARRFTKRSNSTSGFPGVSKLVSSTTPAQGYWVARWTDMEGKRHSKKFSVAKFGCQLAMEKAIACRLKAMEDLHLMYSDIKTDLRQFDVQFYEKLPKL
ncbi:MAG: AP2/ERF family transcription factor [Bacteroidota bacterium]|jgi:hypothetical protein